MDTIEPSLAILDVPILNSETFVLDSDPAKWGKNNKAVAEHLASIKFPFQNICDSFPESVRVYTDKSRYLSKEFFYVITRNGEKIKRDWMVYSKSKRTVFCFVCLLISTRENNFSSEDGFNDWKNATRAVCDHENGPYHRDASIVWVARKGKSCRLDNELLSQIETECKYWKSVLHRIIVTIKFLSSRGLAFQGHSSVIGSTQNGNYLGALEYLSKFDPFIKEHIEKHGNKGKGRK